MPYCKYFESLGIPNKGVHKYGAVADWIMTIILALILGSITWHVDKLIKKNSNKVPIPFVFSCFILFIVLYCSAIFLHYLFCVKTRVNIFLGITK
jgi:hypothetical protein